jgi:3-hydroxyacyl-[acyl-carrier-protein] dehydratase
MDKNQWIIDNLPYSDPFRFVDQIDSIDEERVEGRYHFQKDHDFYKGHFKNNPVTPGVILSECMAQIGVVSLGIYLLRDQDIEGLEIGLTSISADYYIPVFPDETCDSQK